MATPTKSGSARPARSRRSAATKSATPARRTATKRTSTATERAGAATKQAGTATKRAGTETKRAGEATKRAVTESARAAKESVAPEPQQSAAERYARNPRAAAEKAARTSRTRVTIPMIGRVDLPPADELAFMAGIGALVVVGAVEWPLAIVLGAGHALTNRRRNKLLQEFGEALERA
jgi:hypothetical protein